MFFFFLLLSRGVKVFFMTSAFHPYHLIVRLGYGLLDSHHYPERRMKRLS
jgi:hypothetical protein